MGIIACDSCGCANVADSHFCRGCGAEIGASHPRELTPSEVKMIEDAKRLFAEARYDQAALVATAVLEENPYCVEALAVLGDCHERLGYYSLALRSYRDVLKIDPDSKLDALRVERLEKLVASGDIVVPAPNPRRNSLIGAFVAATLLFVSSGSALIVAADLESGSPRSGDGVISQPFLPMPPVATNRTDFVPTQQDAPKDADFQGIDEVPKKNVVAPLVARQNNRNVPSVDGILPGITGEIEGPVEPVRVDPSKVPAQQAPNSDPDPQLVSPQQDQSRSKTAIVDVRPSQGSAPGSVEESPEDTAAKIETLIRVARDQFVIGNFNKSADAYERAILAGAAPSTSYLRLAQCYEKLGRRSDAIGAYLKAISAFELLDQSNVSVQTQLDVCRQAVRVLRGE